MRPRLLIALILVTGLLAIPDAAFSRDETHLQGRWYLNGDPNRPTEITINHGRLEARNENGQTSRLEVDRNGNVRAPDWQGARGDVRGNRIDWSNGTTWTRRPSERFGRR